MTLTLRFFRKSSAPKTDFSKVLEFFDTVPNISIYYSENDVRIEYVDNDFGFAYSFFITKKSYVEQISNLSAEYSNDNFFLVMPLMIPTYLATEILTFAQKVCKQFNFFIYHPEFKDVCGFNLVEVRNLFTTLRAKEIEDNGLGDRLYYNSEILNNVCVYERNVETLKEEKPELYIAKCSVIQLENSNEYGILYKWPIGVPTLFPPHINYIEIEESDGIKFVVTREVLYKLIDGLLVKADSLLTDMYLLRPKKAKKTLKYLNKLHKQELSKHYKELPLCNLIDQGE